MARRHSSSTSRTQQHRVRVLSGVCDALFTPRPFGPLHDIAAQTQGELLARLTSDANRQAIFAACLTELQRAPTLIVFEDVHWADEATLDLLKFLGRRIQRLPVLLLATYRDDELGPQHPLRLSLGDLVSSTATRRITLLPLSEQAVRALIGQRALDPAALHDRTGGNPFFVTEVLASGSTGIPPTVREAVLARAARLSISGLAVLEAAAVIGPRIEPWLLAEVTGAESPAVDQCLTIGMLSAQGYVFAFRHELARQTILDAISPSHRLALHRMTLDALRASPVARTDFARLAHHAAAADDREAVLEYAPAAARQAVAVRAHRAADTLYGLTLRYAHDLPAAQRAQLLDEYSIECDVADRRTEAIETRRQAAALWLEAGHPLKHGASLSRLALLLQITGSLTEAERVNAQALAVLEPLTPNLELVIAYNTQAWLCLAQTDNRQGVAVAEKAVALAQHFEAEEELPRLYEILGLCWLYLDQARGSEYLERALALARKLDHAIRAANIYANLSSIYVDFHEFSRAVDSFAAGLPYAGERDHDSVLVYMLGWQAILEVHLGHWDKAAEIANELVQRPGTSPGRGPALLALGRLRARRGDPEAMTALDESLTILIKQGFRQREGLIRAARAEAAWLVGDRERTLEEARAAYDLAVSHRHPWYVGELAFWCWRAGDPVPLPDWTAKPYALQINGNWHAAAEEWARMGCPYEQARALADGDTAAQIAALEIFERLGARPMADELRHKLQAAGARHIPHKPRASTRDNPFGLTGRQLEILGLLTEGLSNAAIAARLHLSPKTVDHHVSAILARLDVHSREEAAELARRHPQLQRPAK